MTGAPLAGALLHPSSARDAGLLRQIGPLALAAAIINGVVGAGIFSLPSAMSQAAGSWAPLAYLLCAVAMGMVVTCCAEGGSRLPTSGGIYGYVADAFGPFAGFLCGMMTWMASVLACGGIASAFAGTIGSVVPAAAGGLGRAAVILAAIGGITAVNLRGVRGGAGLVSISTAIKLVPLLLFVLLGFFAGPGEEAGPAALPAHDFAQAVILGMFAFSGMETVLGASGEVADPNRTVPRALFGAMGFVLLLYVAIQVVAQRLLGPALAHQAGAPLAAAAARVSHVAGVVLVAGAAVSMLGWIGSDILGAPRVLFAFARDGLLPAVLGRVHTGSRVPHVAILFHACLAASLAISGSFVWLAIAATLNTAGLYFLGCGAAWVLHRRGTHLAGAPLNLRFLPVASVLGMASMVLLIGVAAWDEILGFAAVIAVSSALYVGMKRVVVRR